MQESGIRTRKKNIEGSGTGIKINYGSKRSLLTSVLLIQ